MIVCRGIYKLHSVLFWLLVPALFIACNCLAESDEDCGLKENFECHVLTAAETSWIAFLSSGTKLEIYVAFQDRRQPIDKDVLRFKLKDISRIKRRNRTFIPAELISPDVSLLRGWNTFNAEVKNNLLTIYINSRPYPIECDYNIQALSIISEDGKVLSQCKKGKPTWKIMEGENTTIPLVGLHDINFTLISDKQFTPVLYDSGISIEPITSPLPPGNHEFLMKKQLIYKPSKTGDGARLEWRTGQELNSIEITSLQENFTFELTPANFEDLNIKSPVQEDHSCNLPNRGSSNYDYFLLITFLPIAVIFN